MDTELHRVYAPYASPLRSLNAPCLPAVSMAPRTNGLVMYFPLAGERLAIERSQRTWRVLNADHRNANREHEG